MKRLPPSGTAALLEILSPYLEDELIEEVIPNFRRRGRRSLFSPVQLFRVQLLALLSPVHSFNLLVELLSENRRWREFARLPNKRVLPDAKMLHQFRDRLQLGQLRRVNHALLLPLVETLDAKRLSVGILDSTDLPAAANNFKKESSPPCSARRAAVGARTVKSGQSRWFIGYKKHSFRLWLSGVREQVLLVPLLSWAAPANQNDVLFLEPSLRYCRDRLEFLPDLVLGDLAYLNFSVQRRWRERWQVGVLTALKPDLEIPKAVEPALRLSCAQGQRLQWWGLHWPEQLHWFGVCDPQPLCVWCPEQSLCPREFAFAASAHETVLGTVPVNTPLAQTLRRRVRPWIEAAQSYEKNQLGLGDVFMNSLRLCWILCLLADTVCLLRAHALLRSPPTQSVLKLLLPSQLELALDEN